MRHFILQALLLSWACGSQAFTEIAQTQSFPKYKYRWAALPDVGEERLDDEPEITERLQKKEDDGRKHDMSERFRYSVNAMMGTFDPSGLDDERQDGNILKAVLHFPSNFTFSAVGKTNGEDSLRDEFAEEVKSVVFAVSGDEYSTFEVLPRGTKFTKVQCVVEVQSATMINTIFEDIANLKKTVMRF